MMRTVHVVVALLAFWGAFPTGIFAAAYSAPGFSGGSHYMGIHRAAMITALIFTLIAVGLALAMLGGFNASLHGILGLVAAIFTLLQPVNAYFRPGKEHPRRRIWEIIHKSLGRLVFLLGICNCVVGAFVYKTKYGMGPILFYVSLVVLALVIVVCASLRYRQHAAKNKITGVPKEIVPEGEIKPDVPPSTKPDVPEEPNVEVKTKGKGKGRRSPGSAEVPAEGLGPKKGRSGTPKGRGRASRNSGQTRGTSGKNRRPSVQKPMPAPPPSSALASIVGEQEPAKPQRRPARPSQLQGRPAQQQMQQQQMPQQMQQQQMQQQQMQQQQTQQRQMQQQQMQQQQMPQQMQQQQTQQQQIQRQKIESLLSRPPQMPGRRNRVQSLPPAQPPRFNQQPGSIMPNCAPAPLPVQPRQPPPDQPSFNQVQAVPAPNRARMPESAPVVTGLQPTPVPVA